MTASPDTGLLMVVSPGETELAWDSLGHALHHAPRDCSVFIVDNAGIDDSSRWHAQFARRERPLHFLSPDGALPRPYYEIGRTIFGALDAIAGRTPNLLYKIDPDTLVLNSGFFADVHQLHRERNADFYACHVRSAWRDRERRRRRLWADLLPVGFRRDSGRSRYGAGMTPRAQPVWYWRSALAAALRGQLTATQQPSGGFYAVSSELLRKLAARGFLARAGANGLEWNDDTLLPIAVRATKARTCDIRASRFAVHWRWMHGSRYFTNQEATERGVRAVHPVKLGANDRALREEIGSARDCTP